MSFKKLFECVLEKVKPAADERSRVKKHVDAFISLLNAELSHLSIDAVASVGGSYAKDTWLSGDFDVDVFVKFGKKYEHKKDISDLLESALLNFNPVRIHGSRDYFHIKNEIKFEVVPVIKISKNESAENVTDFSPLHVSWVKKNGKDLKDDIRLAKLFCKSAKCYGAESYIRGFSGHVLDILVIHYRGFLKLLRAAKKWQPKVILDPEKHHKPSSILFNLNTSKTEGPLVLVDPVQPDRNAASALNEENFDRFVHSANAFLNNPSSDFFVIHHFDPESYDGFVLSFESKTGKEDVVGAKIVKVFNFLKTELEDFNILDSGWEWDKSKNGFFWFKLGNTKLSKSFTHKGPPVNNPHASVFRKKYANCYVKDGVLFTDLNRKFTDASKALDFILKSKYVCERLKTVGLSKKQK